MINSDDGVCCGPSVAHYAAQLPCCVWVTEFQIRHSVVLIILCDSRLSTIPRRECWASKRRGPSQAGGRYAIFNTQRYWNQYGTRTGRVKL